MACLEATLQVSQTDSQGLASASIAVAVGGGTGRRPCGRLSVELVPIDVEADRFQLTAESEHYRAGRAAGTCPMPSLAFWLSMAARMCCLSPISTVNVQ